MSHYSKDDLKYMLKSDIINTIELINNDHFDIADLTFLGEYLGDFPHTEDILLKLSHNESVLVREGAIYGMAKKNKLFHLLNDRVKSMAENDTSHTVREIAGDIISDNS